METYTLGEITLNTLGEITLKFCEDEVDLPPNTLYTFRALKI